MHRFIPGPDPEAGTPGGLIAYDDADSKEATIAEQMAKEPGWYEVDSEGNAIPRPPRAPRQRFGAGRGGVRPRPLVPRQEKKPVPIPAETLPPAAEPDVVDEPSDPEPADAGEHEESV